MAIRFFGPSGGAFRPFDSDVLLWQAAVIANGGSVSLARLTIVDQFVYSEKTSGAWDLTDDYWGLWGENAPQALTSLKQRRLATAVNSPTLVADRNYVFDGVSNYLNTGFTPSTHAVAMTGTNLRLSVYERTNVSNTTVDAGCANSGTQSIFLIANNAGVATGRTDSGSLSYTLPGNDSRGYTTVARNGANETNCTGYKNGVALTQTGVAPTFVTSLPTFPMDIGCYNAIGTHQGFRAASIGFVAVGALLSAAQELASYNAVQAWATSIGAQV